MTPIHLLVISPPDVPHLKILETLPRDTIITIALDPAVLREKAPDAEVVLNCTGRAEGLEAILPNAPKLRWIHSLSAGVESQLTPVVAASTVPLTNSRGVYKESLGEFVVAAALFFAKDFRKMLRNQEAGKWEQFDVEELYRQTMGVIGYGEIGRAAARRGKALGMKILAMRRNPAKSEGDGVADTLYPPEQMGDMIAESEVVVVAAPLTPQTRGLVNEAAIGRMKSTAILINVGRGPVIHEPSLIQALQQNRIRGAALDVFEQEPLPTGHPFWTLRNVLLSPHCADHTADWLHIAVEFFVSNFHRFLAGEPLLNVVDKRAGY